MPKKKNNWGKRALAIIIFFAMVAFWRGAWGLLDIYLLPNNRELSLWISIGIGMIILISTPFLVKQLMGK